MRYVESMIGCDEYYRVEVDGDFFVCNPLAGYYYHAGTQVLIDSEGAGSIVVKPTIVESQLLGTAGITLVNHGLHVYRASLEACFEESELREYLNNHISKEGDATSRNPSGANIPDWLFDGR